MKKVQIDYELFRKLIFYHLGVIRQIKRCLFRQIKTGLLWCLIMV